MLGYKLITGFALLFLSHTVAAQEEGKSNSAIEFGLQHSINFTNLTGEGGPIVYANRVENYELIRNRLTFDLGMFAIMHLSKSVAIQPEVVYSYMGGHFQKETIYLHDLGEFSRTENESFAMDYIKAALAVNFKFNDRVYVQLGGYGASLLSAEKFYPWWEVNVDKPRSNLTDIRRMDAGLLGGFGLSTSVVNLSFRYNYGLLDVFERGDLEELDLRHGVLQFVIQWKFFSDL